MDHHTTYVGLDVHKNSITACALFPNGTEPRRWELPNRPHPVRRMVGHLMEETDSRVKFCYEAGPCGYVLQRQIRNHDPQAEKVTLRPLAGERAEPVELEPLEFIARLVQHIPDVRERQVVYYGVYANASKRLPRRREGEGQGASAGTLIPLEEPTPFERPLQC